VPCLDLFPSYDWDYNVGHLDLRRSEDHPCAWAGYVPDEIRQCFAPPRGGSYPARVMFMVGDSHCTTSIPPMNRALADRMTLAPACQPASPFGRGYDINTHPVWLSLRANFRAGDVLCVMNAGAFYDYLFLEELLSSFLRPRNGSLVLLGDNAYLVDTPYDTTVEHPVRQDNVSRDLLYEREEAMVSWARDYPDAHAISLVHLWVNEDGEGNNWIPGTRLNAFSDSNHINVGGGRYLWPYLCDALEQWGVLPRDVAPAEDYWRDRITNLTMGSSVECHIMHGWYWQTQGLNGTMRLHPCDDDWSIIDPGDDPNHLLVAPGAQRYLG